MGVGGVIGHDASW